MRELIDSAILVRGSVRAFEVGCLEYDCYATAVAPEVRLPGIWVPTTPARPNLTAYEWASVVGALLVRRGVQYAIGGMYLEFENVAAPGTPAVIPTYDRTRNIDYYNALSGTRDFLRVPLTAAILNTSDATRFPNGNQPLFFARSQGLQGVHGLPFDSAHNSVIYGAALVAQVDEVDATQDLIHSAFYFAESEQQPKLSTSQVGLEWELTLQ